MRKLFITYIASAAIAIAFQVKAQQQLPGFAPTPTAASIARFGNVPVSPFSGLPSISIPLYSFNVVGLELPLRLDYDASGVQMNVLPGWVGHNWSLAAGGVITRTVNDIPDEFVCPSHDPGRHYFLNYFQSHSYLQNLQYLPNPTSMLNTLLNGSLIYDLEPDVFTFNFLGYHGQFFLGNDGQWKVLSDDNLDIEFNVNDYQNHLLKPFIEKFPYASARDDQPGTIEGFKILDGNGLVYEFGFDTDAIEYTTDFMRQSQSEKLSSWIATSWYLRNIKDRYGNILYSFTYERGEFVAQFHHAYQSTIEDGNDYWVNYAPLSITGGGFSFSGLQATNSYFPLSAALNAPVYLRRIDAADNTYAEFSTTVQDQSYLHNSLAQIIGEPVYAKLRYLATGEEVPQGNIFEYLENPKFSAYHVGELSEWWNQTNLFIATGTRRLKSIKIGSSLTTEYNIIRLDYALDSRPHLRQVRWEEPYNETGVADRKYKLIYDRFESIPSDYLTRNVDHWGHFRSQSFPSHYNNLEQTFSNYRTPEEDYMKRGALTGIIYPTGGMSVLEYEANTFSLVQSLDRSQMIDSAGIGGGLRIKSIKNFEDSTCMKLLSSKSYSYKIPGTDSSSGELIAAPKYYWHRWNAYTKGSNAELNISTFRNSSIVPLVNSFGPSVGYTWVEEQNIDGSKKVYHYSNLSNTQHDLLQVTPCFNTSEPSPYDRFTEFGMMRGKILSEHEYDNNDNLVKNTEFTYRSDINQTQSVFCSNLVAETGPQSIEFYRGRIYNRYYPKYDLVSKSTTTFHGSDSSTVSEIYHRSDRHLVRPQSYFHYTDVRLLDGVSQTRGNSSQEHSFKYTVNCDNPSVLSLFNKTFDLRVVSERIHRNQSLVAENLTEFGSFNINQNQTWLLPKYEIKIFPDSTRDTLATYLCYNKKGIPYHYRLSGEEPTTLSWIVNDCLLGSKYVGKTQIQTGFPIEFHITSDWMRDNARNYLCSIDDGMMCLYSYYPLKGVASITAPNGITTYFDYGKMGVLNLIKDDNFKTIKQFQLNYRLK